MRAEFHKAKEDKERMASLNAALDEKFKLIRAGTFRSKTVDPTFKKKFMFDHGNASNPLFLTYPN